MDIFQPRKLVCGQKSTFSVSVFLEPQVMVLMVKFINVSQVAELWYPVHNYPGYFPLLHSSKIPKTTTRVSFRTQKLSILARSRLIAKEEQIIIPGINLQHLHLSSIVVVPTTYPTNPPSILPLNNMYCVTLPP